MEPGTILCAIPGICWGTRAYKNLPIELLRRFFGELVVLERRITKDVARDDETQRYAQLCNQIEQVALGNSTFAPNSQAFRSNLKKGRFPSLRIGSEYIDLIRHFQLKHETGSIAKGRFGTSVFTPRQVNSHIQYFSKIAKAFNYQYYPAIKHRQWFLTKRVSKNGCGLVEIPDPLSMSYQNVSQQLEGGVDGRDWWERLWEQLTDLIQEKPKPTISSAKRREQIQMNVVKIFNAKDWQQYRQYSENVKRGGFMEQRLRDQIQAAITDRVPINLMNQGHIMVTKIFQEYIHKEKDQNPVEVPVLYNDGRIARSIPIHCLSKLPDGWYPTKEYHFALISMRHLQIDKYIDMNWYRNVEVPARDGMAASDEHCYQVSMRQLEELLNKNRGHRIQIHLYHTGYMPAVVGFYRAILSAMSSDKFKAGSLQVVPKLKPVRDGYIEGKPWPE